MYPINALLFLTHYTPATQLMKGYNSKPDLILSIYLQKHALLLLSLLLLSTLDLTMGVALFIICHPFLLFLILLKKLSIKTSLFGSNTSSLFYKIQKNQLSRTIKTKKLFDIKIT